MSGHWGGDFSGMKAYIPCAFSAPQTKMPLFSHSYWFISCFHAIKDRGSLKRNLTIQTPDNQIWIYSTSQSLNRKLKFLYTRISLIVISNLLLLAKMTSWIVINIHNYKILQCFPNIPHFKFCVPMHQVWLLSAWMDICGQYLLPTLYGFSLWAIMMSRNSLGNSFMVNIMLLIKSLSSYYFS